MTLVPPNMVGKKFGQSPYEKKADNFTPNLNNTVSNLTKKEREEYEANCETF